jgi:cell division transport system permease protein
VPPELRDLFERALSDDPGLPPGDHVREAMAHGTRIRRRRTTIVAGTAAAVVLAVGGLIGINVAGGQAHPSPPVVAALPPFAQLPAGCVMPAEDRATDVSLFLTAGITDEERQRLHDRLQSDGRLAGLTFESREQAFAKFRDLWKDNPDFVKSVSPKDLPESFRGGLEDPADYPAFAAEFGTFPGVDQLVGSTCPGGGR